MDTDRIVVCSNVSHYALGKNKLCIQFNDVVLSNAICQTADLDPVDHEIIAVFCG